MSKTPLLDILPKITEWRNIPYAADLMCQDCGKTGFSEPNIEEEPILVGWCETNYGFMGIFECLFCGSKFRFHGGNPIDDIEEFDGKLCIYFAERCQNWEDLEKEMDKRWEQDKG